jgi:hypothetical protein
MAFHFFPFLDAAVEIFTLQCTFYRSPGEYLINPLKYVLHMTRFIDFIGVWHITCQSHRAEFPAPQRRLNSIRATEPHGRPRNAGFLDGLFTTDLGSGQEASFGCVFRAPAVWHCQNWQAFGPGEAARSA